MASTSTAPQRSTTARAFARSLTMLLKYVRLYGPEHKRTTDQLAVTWDELQAAASGPAGLLLGVASGKLLLDGIATEAGAAEKGFIDLLAATGIASIQFSQRVSPAEFNLLVNAFTAGKPAEVLKQLKNTLPPNGGIRLNEVRYIEDNGKEPDLAAQLTARVLDDSAEKLSDWMNDPQKLLQLIFAAQGATAGPGGEGAAAGDGASGGKAGAAIAATAPLQETEVFGLMQWLTQLGKVQSEADANTAAAALQAGLANMPPNALAALQAALANIDNADAAARSNMLLKLAENLAIRFALERYDRGEVKVNAVREMLDRLNKEMENLRSVVRSHEDTMARSGINVETHAEILDRQFWAAMPEKGKLGVLLSPEAYCIPAKNIRTYVEELLVRPDRETAERILRQYVSCISNPEHDARRKCAMGLGDLAELYAAISERLLFDAIVRTGDQVAAEREADLLPHMSAAFIRLSQVAANGHHYYAIAQTLHVMQGIEKSNPELGKDLRPRVAIEGRVREFVEDALESDTLPDGLAETLQRVPRAAAEHIAVRFNQCTRRQECDRVVALLDAVGGEALGHLRAMTTDRPPAEALLRLALRSRIDFEALEADLLARVKSWTRLQQEELVRQLSLGGAPERGRLLAHLLPQLDVLVRPIAVEEIGLSGDEAATPFLLKTLAESTADATNGFLRVKTIEALGRLKDVRANEALLSLINERSLLGWKQPQEIRIAAAQALLRTSPEIAKPVLAKAGLGNDDLALGVFDSPADWARPRRYPRIEFQRPWSGVLATTKGRTPVNITCMSLAGGVASRESRSSVGPEAVLELTSGLRRLRMNVIVRENRAREISFEILNIELEDLGRLRTTLSKQMPAITAAASA